MNKKTLTFGQFIVEKVESNGDIKLSKWFPPITSVSCNGTVANSNGFKWIKNNGNAMLAVDNTGNMYAWGGCLPYPDYHRVSNKEGTFEEFFASDQQAILCAKYHDHLDNEHIDRILLRTPEES